MPTLESYTVVEVSGLTLAERAALAAIGFTIDSQGRCWKGDEWAWRVEQQLRALCPTVTVRPHMIPTPHYGAG